MFIESPRFPDEIAYGARGGSQYSTSVVTTIDHTEQRNQNWARPLARYEVGLVHRARALTEQLFAFFRTIAQGRTNGFRFKDFLPGEAHGEREVIGVGDGTTVLFQLVKHYQSGDDWHDARVICKPLPGTVVVTVGSATEPPAGLLVNHATGMVGLPTPPAPGVPVYATYDFDVPVRFDTDRLALQRVAPEAWSWGSIVLVETRITL